MVNEHRFWEAAVELAVDVPAIGQERDAWMTRGFCEIALGLEVVEGPIEVLDEAIAEYRPYGVPRRFAERLRGLRARRGPVPEHYPQGRDTPPDQAPIEGRLAESAAALMEFASQLHSDSGTETYSARGGRGAAAVAARADWRPFPRGSTPTFAERDFPPELMWRAWMVLPGRGVVRVVNDERLTEDNFDIWWGVHDGSHLDHLGTFGLDLPAPIEFGSGLLVTEALVMSLELLAAAEAKVVSARGPQSSVRAGLLERVGRLPGLFSHPSLGPLARQEGVVSESEFPEMPTLAAAYVSGSLDLIAAGFVDPLIPPATSQRLRARWDTAAVADAAVATLLTRARGGQVWPAT